MSQFYLIANWKMNKSFSELDSFFDEFLKIKAKDSDHLVEFAFAPPFTLLERAAKRISDQNIGLAAQNVHWEEKGAYTGEISTSMLKEVGAKFAIIGHSERRQFFNENNEDIAKKINSCSTQEITPILCIGENLAERKNGLTKARLLEQLKLALENTSLTTSLIIAYEPVWAIGTGLAASPEQAQEAHQIIRAEIGNLLGHERAKSTKILYGGSMKPSNISELLACPDIDGGLIGGASLDPKTFSEMAEKAQLIARTKD